MEAVYCVNSGRLDKTYTVYRDVAVKEVLQIALQYVQKDQDRYSENAAKSKLWMVTDGTSKAVLGLQGTGVTVIANKGMDGVGLMVMFRKVLDESVKYRMKPLTEDISVFRGLTTRRSMLQYHHTRGYLVLKKVDSESWVKFCKTFGLKEIQWVE